MRKFVPLSPEHVFHLTGRTVNREAFPTSMENVWNIYEDYLFFAHHAHGLRIYAFVLMPNHFHLLARFPRNNMGEAMGYLMGETSRRMGELAGRINQIYGGRFHRSLILDERYFRHAYKYVYRNPVKANFSDRVEDYRYSTLGALLGKSRLSFPVENDVILFGNTTSNQTLDWLNRHPLKTQEDDVRRALRRKIFQLPKNKNSKASNPLEASDY